MTERDCVSSALQHTKLFATVGLGAGFFQAHNTFKKIKLMDKMDRWANMAKSFRVISGPVALYSAVGFGFTATQCLVENLRGKEDSLNGVVASAVAGGICGLRQGSVQSAIGYTMLFTFGCLVSDFFTGMAHPVLDDYKMHGALKPGTSRTL